MILIGLDTVGFLFCSFLPPPDISGCVYRALVFLCFSIFDPFADGVPLFIPLLLRPFC